MEKNKLKNLLQNLEEIIKWFDEQEEVDVEAGLDKVKQGVSLIKTSRERLKEIENEFEKVKKDLDEEK
ncbi:exodeoxyribonuclease VII small subunit [Patescibacteria group bacterium]|nr:exodeoxyribonuclease VII small subunit [Patescibacteria group bacterium]